ncbi:UNVERIFIED_CONTAM: hypothetical protein PYX00_003646 [Menopon gallinae]
MRPPRLSKFFRYFRKSLTQSDPVRTEIPPSPPQGLPDNADVVIIGGGTIGCSTLYQLAKRGVQAILLERNKLTCGTTWHTIGLVWTLRPNDVDIQILQSSRNLLISLKEETGIDPGWINNGGLYIAHNVERLDEYRRLATAGQSFKIDARIVDPDEAKAIFPLLNPNVIVGGLYNPGDGCVNPTAFINSVVRSAKKNGGKIFENCPVTGLEVGRTQFGAKHITGVRTPYGVIQTNCVVNCAGVWGNEIAKMVGLRIPLIPMKHAYVVSESIPKAQGLPNVRDHDGSVYFRVQGDSLLLGGYEQNPTILDKIPDDFAFQLYDLDWTQFPHLANAIHLVPEFETVGIKSTVCGPESFTPDHKPLLGEDPRLQGLYHGVGFNSARNMLSGGCGEQLALWIINGRPDLHMYNYDIRRFTLDEMKNVDWVKERSHESYATNYKIVFPNSQFLAGRNFQTGPFHEELLEANCVFEEIQGWERPGWFAKTGPNPVPPYDWGGSYGNIPKAESSSYVKLLRQDYTFNYPVHHDIIGEECRACREQAALFDRSYLGKFYLSGPDAQAAADWLFTADTRVPLGQIVFTCLLNSKGNIEATVAVMPLETGFPGGLVDPILKGRGFYIVAGGAVASHTQTHIRHVIKQKGFRVTVDNVTTCIGVLSIQGPNSRRLLQNIIDCDLSDESFPFNMSQLVKIGGYTCRALRTTYVGELGYEIHIPWDKCLGVYKVIWKEGKKHNLRHAGYRAFYSLGAEKGYHLWHRELRNDDNPLEAGLESTCRLEGEYLGKEALGRVRFNGIRKKLVYFHMNENIPVWGLETIWRNNEAVGFLRRGNYAFTLGTSLGQGYVQNPNGEEVTEEFLVSGKYEIEVMGKRHPVTMYLRSPFDSSDKRPLGFYDEK